MVCLVTAYIAPMIVQIVHLMVCQWSLLILLL